MSEQQIPAVGVQAITDRHAELVGAITQHAHDAAKTAAVHFDTPPTPGTTSHTTPGR